MLHGYQILTLALSEAGTPRVRKLSIEHALPPGAFVQDLGGDQSSAEPAIAAYCRLTDLKLSFTSYSNVADLESNQNVHGLQSMLASMTSLERLELSLPYIEHVQSLDFLRHNLAFPTTGDWPRLVALTVGNLAISTKDLTTLLVARMPSLKEFTLGRIKLLDGCWEGVFEYLRVLRPSIAI